MLIPQIPSLLLLQEKKVTTRGPSPSTRHCSVRLSPLEIDPAGLPKPGFDPSRNLERFEKLQKFLLNRKYKGYDDSLGTMKYISKEKKKSQSQRKKHKAFDLSHLSIDLPKPNTLKKTVPAEHKHSSKIKKKRRVKKMEYFQKALGTSHICLDSVALEIAFGKRIKKSIKRRQKKQEQRVEKLLEGMEKLDI